MAEKYDVIIVGSGIGGLAAGILLAHQGKSVTIFEKNSIPGGRLSSYVKDGFTLDFGVHMISRGANGPVGECLARVGIHDAIQFTSVRPIVSFNGKLFKFPHDLKEMVPEEDFQSLMRFMRDCKSYSDDQVKSLDFITLKEFLNRYTSNEIIHTCVSRIGSVYCALPSWIESAGEFIRCMTWEAEAKATGYPEGGCIAITNAYLDGIRKFGGKIHLKTPVEKIIIEKNRAVGVVAAGREFKADTIIANGDIKATVLKLVGPEHFDQGYVHTIKNLDYSWGCPVLRLALDEPITDIKMLSQFGEVGQERYYDKLKNSIMPESLNLFVVIPSNFSPSVAPAGRQLISIASSMPTDTPREFLKAIKEKMLDTLEQFVPNLRKHILWMDFMSIDALDNYAGEDGCIIGVAQSATQVGEKRPRIKTPIDGLFFVSGEAGGTGVGIELAINSGMSFFDQYAS